jgi:protein phosphatase 1L
MGHLQWLMRNFRRYFLNVEAIILFVFFVLLYYYFFHSDQVWRYINRFRVRLELKLSGQFDRVPSNGDITSQKSKASWELIKENVGVYAIQGRRPHMEDRFNVITNLEHTNTSTYGIFDGHGGDVSSNSLVNGCIAYVLTSAVFNLSLRRISPRKPSSKQ